MGKFTFGQSGPSYECDKVEIKGHEGAPKCPRCGDRVYFNEEKKALGKSWHTRCFTCCQCKKALSATNYKEYEGELMCTACHRRYAGAPKTPSASSSTSSLSALAGDESAAAAEGATAATLQSAKSINKDDPECCPYCGQRVYFAEEIKALKRKWHRLCFKCVSCRKTLEPGRCTDRDGQLFCQPCYGKRFGPSGYGFAAGAATVMYSSDRPAPNGGFYTDAITLGETEPEIRPTQPISGAQEWTESW